MGSREWHDTVMIEAQRYEYWPERKKKKMLWRWLESNLLDAASPIPDADPRALPVPAVWPRPLRRCIEYPTSKVISTILFFHLFFSVSIRIQSYLLSLSCFSSWQILLTHRLGDVVCLLEYMFASFPFLSKMTSFISFSIISLSVLMKICYDLLFVTI